MKALSMYVWSLLVIMMMGLTSCGDDDELQFSEEQLAYIYEPFYRADDTRNASNGNGLGLYVVSELLKKEGFRYTFEPLEASMRFTVFL